MKKYILPMILICYITFSMTSCAPIPENASSVYPDGANFILLGFWHGIIVPFSIIGKILGLNIGIYDSGKDAFSYWLGYIAALIFYFRVARIFWVEIKLNK